VSELFSHSAGMISVDTDEEVGATPTREDVATSENVAKSALYRSLVERIGEERARGVLEQGVDRPRPEGPPRGRTPR
jgi:hypothetical protein